MNNFLQNGLYSNPAPLVFLSFYESKYSRSATIYNEPDRNVTKSFIQVPTGFMMVKYLWQMSIRLRNTQTTYVIMSPSHLIVIILRFFTTKKIILDAGWPLLDGYKLSSYGLKSKIKRLKIWFLDFISFHFANLVFLESDAQVEYSVRKYKLRRRNLATSLTGFNEYSAFEKSQEIELGLEITGGEPYVFFRGKVNEEAGLENILNAYRDHQINAPLLILTNREVNGLNENLPIQIINQYITTECMSDLYKGALICLGQLSSHPRLERTIPHKAFEAGFHGIPYISMKTKAILEVFPGENQVIFLENDTPEEIANVINNTLQNQEIIDSYSEGIRLRYENHLSQAKIYSRFIANLRNRQLI